MGLLLSGLVVVAALLQTVSQSHTTGADEIRSFLPVVGIGFHISPPPLLLAGLYYDAYLQNEPDEAFQIYNPEATSVELRSWKISDGNRAVAFQSEVTIAAGGRIWCARDAASFEVAFGYSPGCEYGIGDDPQVPNLGGSALRFANSGGVVTLIDPSGVRRDVLVYGTGATVDGWSGPAVEPYAPSTGFRREGQVLIRKALPSPAQGLQDTDTRADWIQDPSDPWHGKRTAYPGWDRQQLDPPTWHDQASTVSVFVSPDNAYSAVAELLQAAQRSIRFEGYTFESAALAETVASRARAGVDVILLLDGSPAGGVTDQQRWITDHIASAGGRIYYLRDEAASGIHRRYAYQHAKFWIVDECLALISSENPSPGSLPNDDFSDGTYGRRGVHLLTDAVGVVTDLSAIMDADLAGADEGVPALRDIWAWNAVDPVLGGPPAGFAPSYTSGGNTYRIRMTSPLYGAPALRAQVISAPDYALDPQYGWLATLAEAGPGDTVLVEEMYEHTFWGSADSNVASDPNQYLEGVIAAARRGAKVRVLLDSFFDDKDLGSSRSNLRTLEYLAAMARQESLDLLARRGNPTGEGIHNKMGLARVDGQGWLWVGSLNGGEVSAKLDREVSLLVASNEAYTYLEGMFWQDWNSSN